MASQKRLAVAVGTACVAIVALVACSSSTGDGASSSGDTDGGSSGTSSGSSGTPVPKDGAPGCASIGPKMPGAATSVPRAGMTTAAWQSPENALKQDDVRTQAILSEAVPSTDELRVTKFGFAVPAAARIVGIQVDMRRQAVDPGAIDDKVQILAHGEPVGRYKYVNVFWPTSAPGTHPYGGASDNFATTLTGADVSKDDFGVSVSAKLDVGAISSDPAIDFIAVTVHYCE